MTMISTSIEQYRNLLDQNPDEAEIANLLAPIGFSDRQAAHLCLQRIGRVSEARSTFAECLPTLLFALSEAAHPDRVLISLERFARNVSDRPALFRQFVDNPRTIELLVILLAGSQFLSEILLRNPEYFTRLTNHKNLSRLKESSEFFKEAQLAIHPSFDLEHDLEQVNNQTLSPAAIAEALDALRRFQRWQLLRLGSADLLGLLDTPTVTGQLSNLADSLIRICLLIAAKQSKRNATEFVVLGMGKLGGSELNYSSDIDLLFLAATNGPACRLIGQRLIEHLTKVTAEGFLYRVDMRLRPWGRTGPLVTSLKAYLSYLNQHARLWERQALLKARPVAGNEELGHHFLKKIGPLLFETPMETIRAGVHTMKQRIEKNLRKRGRQWGEVKLGEGSIRDIEFVTQYLQLAHGRENRAVRSANTLDALARLLKVGVLSVDEHRILATGYTFLRPIEHYLQLMHYQQTHTLPGDPEALNHLARRLGFRGGEAGTDFIDRYQRHTSAIRVVYRRHLENSPAKTENIKPAPPLDDHLSRMAHAYAEAFNQTEIKGHTRLMSRLNDDNPVAVEAIPLDDERWQITIVGYDYLGEFSLICGLMVIYRLNIIEGQVFTYQPSNRMSGQVGERQERWARIVDVFTVRPITPQGETTRLTEAFWRRYSADLASLVGRLAVGEGGAVRRELINRFVEALDNTPKSPAPTLYPIDIRLDIETNRRYTILHIEAQDTIGFLYEFSNALALNRVYIARVAIQTIGNRIQDTLYVTNVQGRKITAPEKLLELRAATVLVKHFTRLLPRSPNPATALAHFREFLGQLFTRPDWPNEIATLIRPEVLNALAQLLGVSDFLWDDFLRMQHANLFPVIRDVETLAQTKPKSRLQIELEAILQFAPDAPAKRRLLNEFKDREMFRIDMRHILGHTSEYGQFSGELSDLAEVVLATTYHFCYQKLRRDFGDPRQEEGQPCLLALCALGKFGGRELGFASDIELMFIYAGSGHTTGPEVILSALFYEKLVQTFQRTIQAKHEGIFEIDLRLRPYGRAGRMAVPLDSFRRYFGPAGSAWDYERQALVKLRPIAGDMTFGKQIVALRDKLIYAAQPFDVAAMRGMRERQIRHLVTAGTINAKYSPGALVDIEYLVQGLQLSYGHIHPDLRVTNTRAALAALHRAQFLSQDDYEALYRAYNFLRSLINALRMVRGHAKDLSVPATDSEEFAFLARRLNYGHNFSKLRRDLSEQTTIVQGVSTRLLDNIK